jgi:DNA primase
VHCFVCNRGADAIGWLQDSQGLTFSEAVQELARRYHLRLPEQDPQAAAQAEAHHRECQRLLAWRERQQQQFHQALLADLQQLGPASHALSQRGLSDDTAKTWGLGLNGSRLMLPLRDGQGRIRAFSGRSLTGEDPKYLNSPNDALFRKQDLLFGLDRAGPAIRRSGEALLVEGPLDVIQLHQAGLDHSVASLGTAFSLVQAQRLLRSGAKRLWIALDGDKAGQSATNRVIEALQPLTISGQLDLLVVSLPAGEDPDSLVRHHGAEALRTCLGRARHWLLWQLDQLLADLQTDPDDFSALQRCERQGAELLALLPAGALRQKAEQRLREGLGVVPEAASRKGSVPRPGGGAASGGATASGGKADGARHANGANPHTAEPNHSPGAPTAQESVAQAERRALRLFLCCPTLREVLSVLVLTDPLHREAMGWLWCLSKRLGAVVRPPAPGSLGAYTAPAPEDGLRAAALAALPHLDPPLAALLSPFLLCGEAVRARLAAQPEGELMCILDVLEPVA